jgi:nucleotide-binding universal stress UspA family protein
MESMFETIVWATDGSELADRALEPVRQLAGVHGSRIVAVHANELFTGRVTGVPVLADEPDIRKRIESQVAELRADGFDARLVVRSGNADTATLVEQAAEDVDADLIVVCTHGRGVVTSAVMGSMARALCHASSRPVLVVPPTNRSDRTPDEADRLTTA